LANRSSLGTGTPGLLQFFCKSGENRQQEKGEGQE
jgi:hypothetical protein